MEEPSSDIPANSDSLILKTELLKPRTRVLTESEIEEASEHRNNSDVMVITALSQTKSGVTSGTTSRITENTKQQNLNNKPTCSETEVVDDKVEQKNRKGTELDISMANGSSSQPETEGNNHETDTKGASKKGPPPGLLPLGQKPSTPEASEGRVPRKAAIKSAERTKAVTQLEKTRRQEGYMNLEEAKGLGDADAPNVTIRKVIDPVVEICRTCNKEECCLFHTVGRHSKADLKFCSRKCVQNFFKYGNIHFPNPTSTEEDKNSRLRGPQQQDIDIVVEPDIEIHTLSDEFQDCEESESITSGSAPSANANVEMDIMNAAKESLYCFSCKCSLYARTDALLWEAMEFCSEKCLKTYIKVIGSHCNTCNSQVTDPYLGKLCVRFGTVIRQFCASECLNKFKRSHSLCAQCQTNIPDKEKKYCSVVCEELSKRLLCSSQSEFLGTRCCAVCTEMKPIESEIFLSGQSHWLCSQLCRNAFHFANKITTLKCGICSRYFDCKAQPRYVMRSGDKGLLTNQNVGSLDWFCSSICFATKLYRMRSIEQCPRCMVKKYKVDMICRTTGRTVTHKGQPNSEMVFYCSLFCYSHHLAPPREVMRKKTNEAAQPSSAAAPESSPMAKVQAVAPGVVGSTPLSLPFTIPAAPGAHTVPTVPAPPPSLPVAPALASAPIRPLIFLNKTTPLASAPTPTSTSSPVSNSGSASIPAFNSASSAVSTTVSTSVSTISPAPIANGQNSAPAVLPASTSSVSNQTLIPIDVQHKVIFVPPQPKEMRNKAVWCKPNTFSHSHTTQGVQSSIEESTEDNKKPLYIPVPIPIPVPIYVPVPMMMYNYPVPFPVGYPVPLPTPVVMPFEADMLAQVMSALEESKKEAMLRDSIASDSDQLLDLEMSVPLFTVRVPSGGSRKRSLSTSHSSPPLSKRLKETDSIRSASDGEDSNRGKPVSLLNLKGGFHKDLGQKAWSQWLTKRKEQNVPKLSESSLLEMNQSLTAFVREARKPNGESYRPDMLLYFLYGLQLSFGADRRRENMFMDSALEPFQEELDKHLKPFYDSLLDGMKSESGTSVQASTVLKESHLWECRQLGVESPIVLVFTMLYFNTKFFRMYTAEQHERLAFPDIQKVIQKRPIPLPGGQQLPTHNGSSAKAPTKIYCLQLLESAQKKSADAAAKGGVKAKRPFEQPQIVDRPSVCPIKHYNFYLMKCPESVRTRMDVFYLIPETSCTPDSQVWYSTQPVPRPVLARMLRRVMLIEEVLHNLCDSD